MELFSSSQRVGRTKMIADAHWQLYQLLNASQIINTNRQGWGERVGAEWIWARSIRWRNGRDVSTINFSIESLQAPVQTCYWHQADNICEGYSVKTRQGKNLQSLFKELIPLPNVFVQDIPQEAETTGNVCPASRLLHACTYIYCRRQSGHINMSGCFHG